MLAVQILRDASTRSDIAVQIPPVYATAVHEILDRLNRIGAAKSDVPILVAAARAQVDFLATLNTRHFLNDPEVARRSGVKIGTPGDALAWIRQQLSKKAE